MIHYSVNEHIATIQMNWMEKRNALGPQMISELSKAFDQANDDTSVRIVVLTGSEHIFSAGADLKHLEDINNYTYEENLKDSNSLKDLFLKIYAFEKPVVALANGHAIAGGCGLASVCDIVLAHEKAKFGYTEVKIGFIAALVMVFLKTMIPEKKALNLLLGGQLISAKEASEIGLVTHVLPENNFHSESKTFLNNLLDNSPNAMVQTKRFFKSFTLDTIKSELEAAAQENAKMRKTEECQEGIRSFLEKRSSNWKKK